MNILRPGAAKIFSNYVQQVFSPYILSQLLHVSRVDVVWDEYLPESLKAETRSKRGKRVPGNWSEFLRIDNDKGNLFSFLATRVTDLHTENSQHPSC